MDTSKPSVTSAAVDGTTLTITFSEALNTTAPGSSAFTVTKGSPATDVTLTGTPSISGRSLTLTLSTAIADADTNFKVSYTKPSNNPVKDLSGKEADAFSDSDVSKTAALMVSFGSPSYRLAEGTRVNVTVNLSKIPTAAVTIPLSKTNQGNADNNDYSGVPSEVTFTAGGPTSTSFTVEAAQDTTDDDGESVMLEFGTLPSGVNKVAPTETTITIDDDDYPASVTVAFQSATYSVVENGTVDITVTASEDPERTISIPVWITYQGGATLDDYSGVMGRINLNAGSTSKVITVGSAADSGDNECEQVTLEFGTAPSGVVIGATGSTTIITDPETGTGAGTASDPKPIRVGLCGIQEGEIAIAGEQDWYSFEAAGGQPYIIEGKQPLDFIGGVSHTVSGALMDVSILSVTDNSDSPLLGEHPRGGFTLLDARAFFTPPQDGTYKVSIGAGVSSLTGNYTVSVRADDHADDYKTQAGIVLRPGASVTARLDSDVAPSDPYLNEWDWTMGRYPDTRQGIEMMDDRDMFRYEISNAGIYELYLSGHPADTGIWAVYDRQENTWAGGPRDTKPVASFERHYEPGTFYAEVGTSYLSHANTGAFYTLHLEATASGATGAGSVRSDAPQSPTSLDVVPQDSGELSATWQAPTSGPTPTGYTIEWKTVAANWENPDEVSETGVTKTSHVITGLTGGVEYAVRVVATRDDAGSNPSEEVTATPPGATPPDTTTPELVSATVEGTVLTLTLNEPLDTEETPHKSAFAVAVAGISKDVNTVAVSGSAVTLTLVTTVSAGETVTVDYTAPTDPAAARLQNLAGNAADSFRGQTVTNVTTSTVPLTVSAHDVPPNHDGYTEFTFELRLSEEPAEGFSYLTLRDHAFTVTGGEVVMARRLEKNQNVRWEITVEPIGDSLVTIMLPATTDCAASGAVCTQDGRMLSRGLEFEVPGLSAPAINSSSSFRVAEGATEVATLSADDGDTPPADLTWSVSGGADAAKFAVTAAGALSFTAAKDYETPDDADTDGVYTVAVQVSDGGRTDSADLTVTLNNVNEAPTADAGVDQENLAQGDTVTLNGSGADPDAGETLSFAWVQTSGTTVTLSDNAAAQPTFTAPAGPTSVVELIFTLRVTDHEGLFAEDSVKVGINPPLTASEHDLPDSHDGSTTFTFELRFSETPREGFSYRTMQDHALIVIGGEVTEARRLEQDKNLRWEISVTPDGNDTVTILLPATTDCEADGAICTDDGRMLSNRLEITITGPDG